MPHYFSEEQTSPFKINKIAARLRGELFEFYTSSGVFSPNNIDRGTEILINYLIIKEKWDILDLGCGYGAVGIVIAKHFPKNRVIMADINKRAVKLSKMNLRLNNLINAEVRQGNLFETVKENEKFDSILVNPPQTAGKKVCFEIIEKSKNYIKEKGLLQLVARHNIGGKELSKKMKEVFGNVKDIAKKSGYRVYISEN